jgi:magnesium transporter
MNVHVPGQGIPVRILYETLRRCALTSSKRQGYAWFISIIAGLAAFAVVGGYSTYRFMVRR